ncbi:MAG TPA: CAP domain-containing protein [Terriglobia bacterium]|nr:CAP domain-containing protein [Terriglobia bacterium]
MRTATAAVLSLVAWVAAAGVAFAAARAVQASAAAPPDAAARVADCAGNVETGRRQTEKRVVVLVNEERRKLGLPELKWNDALAGAARHHSCRMMALGFLDHVDPQFGEVSGRLRTAGLDTTNLGENILREKGHAHPARHAVRLWMSSPEHRGTLLDPTFHWAAVGIAIGRDGSYWLTADFSGEFPQRVLPAPVPSGPARRH